VILGPSTLIRGYQQFSFSASQKVIIYPRSLL
jgi:hypothetical protein